MIAQEKKLTVLKKKLLAALHEEGADFALNLVSNAKMNELKKELMARKDFKGAEARKIAKEKIVNVLSFPEPEGFPHPETGKRWLGEVYLNSEIAKTRPETMGFLMTHGVLHLLGYRHERLRDTMEMETLEKELCKTLSISWGV